MTVRTSKKTTIVLRTEEVPTNSLSMYHKNPRVGNVDLIAESLKKNGQFRPILVNVGTETGRPDEILAGNHTWLGVRRLGWKTIHASFIDVDEDTARRIVLADNKTSDNARYDDAILTEIMAQVPDIVGTGYTQDEVDSILKQANEAVAASAAEADLILGEQATEAERVHREGTFDGAPLGEEAEMDPNAPTEDIPEQGQLEAASDQVEGMYQFKPPEQLIFDGVPPWGIPKFRPDRLMTFDMLPSNLESWAGSATKDWPDPDQWWLYNYGVDSTSGMKDVSKIILAFYVFDEYFINWFNYPERYVAKLLNSKVKYMITPDYSQHPELPKIEALWALYKSRWIGRYCQEAGLYVIPDITWIAGDLDWLEKYVCGTLPKNLPMIAMQLQTIDKKKLGTEGLALFKKEIKMVFDTLQPQGALIYSGVQGRELMDELAPKEMPYLVVRTRIEKLSAQAKMRSKKTGL